MSTETWAVQVSVKTPSGSMVNLRGDNVAELEEILDAFMEKVAAKVGPLEQTLGAVATVGAAFPGAQVTTQASAPAPQASAPQAAGAPGPAPIDRNGKPMIWKTGTSKASGKAWKGWFPDYAKGDPAGAGIEVQWVR